MAYCSVCSDPERLAFVNRRLADGSSYREIERLSRLPDSSVAPLKYETVQRHSLHVIAATSVLASHNGREVKEVVSAPYAPQHSPQALAARVALGEGNTNDIATLIRDQVAQKLNDGELRLTAQHGLQAQQMLDRRAERESDRALRANIARLLLSHGIAPAELAKDVTGT